MSEDIDIYRIARLLLKEHGVFAANEIKERIAHYTAAEDFNSIKTWYDVEDALREIQNAGDQNIVENRKEEVLG